MEIIISFIQRAILQGTPLLFGATGEILTEKSGNLNLGIPGIMYIGAISGVAASSIRIVPPGCSRSRLSSFRCCAAWRAHCSPRCSIASSPSPSRPIRMSPVWPLPPSVSASAISSADPSSRSSKAMCLTSPSSRSPRPIKLPYPLPPAWAPSVSCSSPMAFWSISPSFWR